MLHDFQINTGSGTVSGTQLGISGDIVLSLTENIPPRKNHILSFGNWFPSHGILVALKERCIWSSYTVRSNRFSKYTLKSDKDLKKKEEVLLMLKLILKVIVPLSSGSTIKSFIRCHLMLVWSPGILRRDGQ